MIGDDGVVGLTDQARRILTEADLVIGTASALSLLRRLASRSSGLLARLTHIPGQHSN